MNASIGVAFSFNIPFGQVVSPDVYRVEFGVDTTGWSEKFPRVFPQAASRDATLKTNPLPPCQADCGAHALPDELPEVGDWFLGFELVGELGRGAFGRVYLARQGDLANRFVALKVTAQFGAEPQQLAQLQHTNIVPIYSLHSHGGLQATCMPFLGAHTLADVLGSAYASGDSPNSGGALFSTIMGHQPSTVAEGAPLLPVREEDDHPKSETLRQLGNMRYVDAACWIVARVARGLAHAHEHQIIHRDLKPATFSLATKGNH